MEFHMAKKKVQDIIKFSGDAGKLESTFRFSETLKDMKESVADHSWRLTLMTFLISEELDMNLDVGKALKLALVHDLAEAFTGEIDAWKIITGKVSKKSKFVKEKKAMDKMTKGLQFGNQVKSLWQEYEDQNSKEAKLVRGLDKIEAFLSIYEAGHQNYKKKVFHSNYADEAVNNFPQLKPLLSDVKEMLKKEMKKGKIKWVE
jgi:putative hydrolases of HD superfamily